LHASSVAHRGSTTDPPLRERRRRGSIEAVGRGADDRIVRRTRGPRVATILGENDIVTIDLVIAFGVRLMLVLLFLPFSALDKILNRRGAVAQASEVVPAAIAPIMIGLGLFVEVVMTSCVLFGVADRFAAFVLAGYCVVTALLWKPFWKPGDFRAKGPSKARDLFWDFWKNVAVAGGFLLVTFGPAVNTVPRFFEHPFESTHPYRLADVERP